MKKKSSVSIILVTILILSSILAAYHEPDSSSKKYLPVHNQTRMSDATTNFVNLTSVEVLPNLRSGTSLIRNVISEPGEFEIICGQVNGEGSLGETEFQTNGSIFVRYRSDGLNLDLVSMPIENYYEDDREVIFPYSEDPFPMEFIQLNSCNYAAGTLVLLGLVSGHHEFHQSNITTQYKSLNQVYNVNNFMKFVWIFDIYNNTSTTSYFASSPQKTHVSDDGEILILTKIPTSGTSNHRPYTRIGTLDQNYTLEIDDPYYYALMEVSRGGELISYDNISAQMFISEDPCYFRWIEIEFDDFRNNIHFLSSDWSFICEMEMGGEIISRESYLPQNGLLHFLSYSWEFKTWMSPIMNISRIHDSNDGSLPQMGEIESTESGVTIALNRYHDSQIILGEEFNNQDDGELFVLRFDSNLNHINTTLSGTGGNILPSSIINIDGFEILGGSYCWEAGSNENCTLTMNSQLIERADGWDAFIAIRNHNNSLSHLSGYGAGNFSYYNFPIPIPNVKGTHEFPNIIEATGDFGFLTVIRFHEDIQYADTSIPAKQSAVFRFHFDRDLDGVRDEIDNCKGMENSEQEDHDNDEIGDLCDSDIDGDSLTNNLDNCPIGMTDWLTSSTLDIDGDGCRDIDEDEDDDGDTIFDLIDNCAMTPNFNQSDLDEDVVGDVCDFDIDGDTISNLLDECPQGEFGWVSGLEFDYDGDGCKDATEDMDDDNDGTPDLHDSCPLGELGWIQSPLLDLDGDGCLDSSEDSDDDGDGVPDVFDNYPMNPNRWFGLQYISLVFLLVLLVAGYISKKNAIRTRPPSDENDTQ